MVENKTRETRNCAPHAPWDQHRIHHVDQCLLHEFHDAITVAVAHLFADGGQVTQNLSSTRVRSGWCTHIVLPRDEPVHKAQQQQLRR